MLNFKEQATESTQMRLVDLLPKKVKRMIYRVAHQDKYKGALLMMKALRKDPDVISRGLSKQKIQAIAADHFGLNHREFARVLDRKTRYEEKTPARPQEDDSGWVEEYITEARTDTTLNASITELFPALAFNNKSKPVSVEAFKKFVYKLNLDRDRKSFMPADKEAAKLVIEKIPSMEERFSKDKIENAIGITNYLYELHDTKPISHVVWGYRAKPRGIPKNHAGDIFVFFRDKSVIGVSLKAGSTKSREPLLNTYVGTQYKKRGWDTTELQNTLWDRVYSQVPGVTDIATKTNYMDKKVKPEVVRKYVEMFLLDQKAADVLYHEQTKVCRQQLCKEINKMSTADFIQWLGEDFNLEKKGEKVPLILVKAVGTTASRKGDDLAPVYKTITDHKAYLDKNSVQAWMIDVYLPEGKMTLDMVCRSDSGVRAEKGVTGQGRLGKFMMLKVLYKGIL